MLSLEILSFIFAVSTGLDSGINGVVLAAVFFALFGHVSSILFS